MLGKRPNQGQRIRDLIVGAVLLVLLWVAIPRTEWYRHRYDEVTRTENALSAHPVNVALRDHKPAEWKPIEAELRSAAAAGVNDAELLARVRVQHLKLARHYVIYAPAPAVIRYAEAVLAALHELQAVDPAQCVQLAWARAGPAFDPTPHLQPHTVAGYEAAIADVIAHSDTGSAVRYLAIETPADPDPARACAATIELLTRSLREEPEPARRVLANMLRS